MKACFYWEQFGASPGEPVAYGTEQALALYRDIQAHGWEQVQAFRSLRMSRQEAEALFTRVQWLQANLPGLLARP